MAKKNMSHDSGGTCLGLFKVNNGPRCRHCRGSYLRVHVSVGSSLRSSPTAIICHGFAINYRFAVEKMIIQLVINAEIMKITEITHEVLKKRERDGVRLARMQVGVIDEEVRKQLAILTSQTPFSHSWGCSHKGVYIYTATRTEQQGDAGFRGRACITA